MRLILIEVSNSMWFFSSTNWFLITSCGLNLPRKNELNFLPPYQLMPVSSYQQYYTFSVYSMISIIVAMTMSQWMEARLLVIYCRFINKKNIVMRISIFLLNLFYSTSLKYS